MKTRITRLALIIPFGLFVLLFSGCYTRLATVEDRRSEPEQYGSRDQGNDSGYYAGNDSGNYYDENSSSYYDDSYGAYPHNRVGFSYYYPSTYWPSYAFSVAYSNPWAYDSYWAYDPWWCGTPYVHYPAYGGYYPYSYYPYSYYYPYGSSNAVYRTPTRTRDFGSRRGSTAQAPAVNTNYSTPSVDRSSPPSNLGPLNASSRGSSRTSAPAVSGASRQGTPQSGNATGNRSRINNNNNGRGIRSAIPPVGRSRAPASRDAHPQVRPNERNAPPPASSPHQQRQKGDSTNHGYSRSSAPRYAPPSITPSSPPATRSGATPSGGSRGGSARGGRP